MGKNMVSHLLEQGVRVVAYNRTKEVTEEFRTQNIERNDQLKTRFKAAYSVRELVSSFQTPRVIWMMVPNGNPVDEVIAQLLAGGIEKGDYVIDGGNTYYKDTVRRSRALVSKGIHYIDCGTSGGLEGARNGACLMVGGAEDAVRRLSWLWNAASGTEEELTAKSPQALAKGERRGSWSYFGPSGAGHFVKMVHNGVEYGMNQAIGEGFEILAKGPYQLDFAKVANNWGHGSVVRSWLVELLSKALEKDPQLDTFEGKVGGGQTGSWATEAAKEFGVDAVVLEDALSAREKSQIKPTFAGKVVSALRAGYGGHKEPK